MSFNQGELIRAQQKINQQIAHMTSSLTQKRDRLKEIESKIPQISKEVRDMEHEKPLLKNEIRELEKDIHDLHEELEKARKTNLDSMQGAGLKNLPIR